MSDRWTSPGSPDPDDRPDGPGSNGEPEGTTSGGQGAQQPPGQPQGWSAPPAHPGWSGGHPQQYGGWSGGPGPSQGWGGGPGGYGPPPPDWYAHRYGAAKPGVIPLRPLGVGELLDGAVSTARAHWRAVLAIALTIAVVTELIAILAIRSWFQDTSGIAALENNPEPTNEEVRTALGELLSFTSVVGVATLLGTVLATAMLTMVVSRAVLGENVTVGEAWADARPQLLRLLGLILTVSVAVAVAIVAPVFAFGLSGDSFLGVLGVLGGLALGVWLWVNLSLAAPALMLERQRVFAALGRSWKLVKGSWWRVFGIQLLVMVLVALIGTIVQLPASAIAELFTDGTSPAGMDTSWTGLLVLGAGSVIASVVTLPLSAGVTALLYIDRRIRREALDLDLARAAGLDGPRDGQ